MLNSEICMSAAHSGNNSYNKRLKALENAIASYSDVVASKKGSFNDSVVDNLDVKSKATINQETVEQSTIQDLDVNHIDNRGGFAALGTVTVESLTVGSDVKADYENLNATNLTSDHSEIVELEADKATVKNLEVTNKMDRLDLARLYIDSVLALSQTGLTLKIAEAFHRADFKCSLRPTWQDHPIALSDDLTTVFSLKGIVNDSTELPTGTDGDTYFVRSYTDGALTGPAIAAFVDGTWNYILYPGLDDYINENQFNDFRDALETRLDNDEESISNNTTEIESLQEQIEALLHQLNETSEDDPTWLDWRNSVDEFVSTTYPTKIAEIEEALEKRITDPESSGQFLRQRTSDGTASWVKLEANDAFLNKKYEDDDKGTQITNDENGLTVETTLGFKATTPASTETTTKEVINQDYIRKNLRLSKESGSDGKSTLTYNEVTHFPQSDHIYLTGYYENCQNAYIGMYNWPSCYHVKTKNYDYYRLFNYTLNEASTYTWFFSLDKNGSVHKMNNVEDERLNTEAQALWHSRWSKYNPEAWNGETDDVAYYCAPRALYNSVNQGYINVYKDGKFYGHVKDVDDNEFGIYEVTTNFSAYRHMGGKSLRNSESPRMLIVNNSDVAADNVKAYLIGVDANGEEALDRGKPVVLPTVIKWGVDGVAAGKNYWWFQNGMSNIFSRIDKDGNIASYTLVDPIDSVALSASALRNTMCNYIELDNGDVIFYVSNCVAAQPYDYFIYCSDDPNAVAPVTVFRSSVKFSNVESNTDRWPLAIRFPFFQCGNYVYFMPTDTATDVSAGSQMGSGNTTWWKTVANQYARLDLQSMTWSYTQVPWTIGNYASYGFCQHVKTEGGYVWVFPMQTYDATQLGSICLVIAPNGQATTVDLGTGSAINWFYSQAVSPMVDSWSNYLNYSGTANWAYARQPITLIAVNSHGLGILVSPDAKHVMLFKGNGEFHLYDYSSGLGGLLPEGYTTMRSGPSLIPMKDGALYGVATSITYRGSGVSEVENRDIIYISTTGADVNIEPTFKQFQSIDGGALFMKYREEYGNNMTFEDYERRFLVQHDTRLHVSDEQQTVGLAYWREAGESSGGSIYLKDGDYEISEVEV